MADSKLYRKPPSAYSITNPRVLELYTKRPYWSQDSIEWLEERTKYLTASPLAAICRYGRFSSRAELFRKKTSPMLPRMDTAATSHGHTYEPIAIDKYEKEYDTHVLQFSLVPHDTKTWLAVSPDGITPDGIMIEVKCPYSRKILPAEGYDPWGCPKQYYPQVQAQLEVCDLEVCHFVQYWHKENHMLVTEIKRDREWWVKWEPEFKKFWGEVLVFRNSHPDWQTVDHHPPRPKKRALVDLFHESELSPQHKKMHAMIDQPIIFETDDTLEHTEVEKFNTPIRF